MQNLKLEKIAGNNRYIDVKKIKEVMEYIKQIEPFIDMVLQNKR